MKQIALIPKPKLNFGGTLEGCKASARVLSTKRPTHLVLKGMKIINLRKRKELIERIIQRQSETFGIKLYCMSVQFDHVHVILKIPCRAAYNKFIRAVTGLLARQIKKGLWIFRPFTRVVSWGHDFRSVIAYVFQNEMEVLGLRNYKKRSRQL